jgi:hypothetical protein
LKPASQLKLIEQLLSIVNAGISGDANSVGIIEQRHVLIDRLGRRSEH